ncbi:MAG: DNA-binding response regulator [Ignavibacteria bacterium RIFOXYB2_FULL_35_12]|nr:MAG: DNA-binding response regulator [Ignavibacteria bacterium GWA2_36_19]OGU51518.1 MAG: DNA-binding response regulator [Ignavibacteria bacterium GWC2_35_8]OGU62495.1 MAG: DNA-binding response regulator [Ignavibacteria bacterium GWF2_35_20]OGU81729.1 MAG: DNA-binding response regulator [Ignavibacteria bacterium RIFOXYA2_FULL_35_9]OGU86676.1 MAG: DNA-binding response regulator [Ignavibacteria bacterium RIFOXYA12_FULL_35_25]OGU87983.1 MAG: DNA-binding response regulator [Ignavibacteria bacter
MSTILIVEDDEVMLKSLQDAFEHNGFDVLTAMDGESGLQIAEINSPDSIILDVMLPRTDGFNVCRTLRKRGVTIPIIMLTARAEEIDKVVGLEIGADDYVTKPFSTRELLARVKAHLRRTTEKVLSFEHYEFGNVTLDLTTFKAFKNKKQIDLTSTEYSLMKVLIKHRNEVVPREKILNEVWGYDSYPSSRSVDNHVLNLRQKLEDNPDKPEYILTVHGLGYKFVG